MHANTHPECVILIEPRYYVIRVSTAYLVNALACTAVQSAKRGTSYATQCETVLGIWSSASPW